MLFIFSVNYLPYIFQGFLVKTIISVSEMFMRYVGLFVKVISSIQTSWYHLASLHQLQRNSWTHYVQILGDPNSPRDNQSWDSLNFNRELKSEITRSRWPIWLHWTLKRLVGEAAVHYTRHWGWTQRGEGALQLINRSLQSVRGLFVQLNEMLIHNVRALWLIFRANN